MIIQTISYDMYILYMYIQLGHICAMKKITCTNSNDRSDNLPGLQKKSLHGAPLLLVWLLLFIPFFISFYQLLFVCIFIYFFLSWFLFYFALDVIAAPPVGYNMGSRRQYDEKLGVCLSYQFDGLSKETRVWTWVSCLWVIPHDHNHIFFAWLSSW